jgi:hypothetical protein
MARSVIVIHNLFLFANRASRVPSPWDVAEVVVKQVANMSLHPKKGRVKQSPPRVFEAVEEIKTNPLPNQNDSSK